MNNLERVSIGGFPFSLETDAYNKVRAYLDELEAFYRNNRSGKEIMEGIEERMAELFFERCGNSGVVTDSIASEVTAILGMPKDIEEESTEEYKPESEVEPKPQRRLFRDPRNKFIAGVLAGLASYFKIDVVIVRIAVLLLAVFGWWLGDATNIDILMWLIPLCYIVLWICMPVASTVQQRLQMKGERASVDQIQQKVENDAQYPAHSESGRVIWRIIKIIIGLGLFNTGLSLMIGTTFLVVGGALASTMTFADGWGELVDNLPFIVPFIAPLLAKIGVVLFCFIPCIGMIYGGICLIFNVKKVMWRPGLFLFIFWVILLIALSVWAIVAAIPTI